MKSRMRGKANERKGNNEMEWKRKGKERKVEEKEGKKKERSEIKRRGKVM